MRTRGCRLVCGMVAMALISSCATVPPDVPEAVERRLREATSPPPEPPPPPPAPSTPEQETLTLSIGVVDGVTGGMVGGVVGGVIGGVISGVLGGVPGGLQASDAWLSAGGDFNTEEYDHLADNPFLGASDHPLSTFAIDVDTASYANVRRFLYDGSLPPVGAVRIEELINYFRYVLPEPEGDAPFGVGVEINQAPWEPSHRLVRIGLQGKQAVRHARPPTNLVFLIDVSGSMQSADRLPLAKASLARLAAGLTGDDRIAIVVYAGAAGLALPSIPGDDRGTIMDALARLSAGGSTAGGEGILLAYEIAAANHLPGGINRVILATDGDFNVGVTNAGDLVRLVEERAASGTMLTVLGFGRGNLNDSMLEKLADHGDGSYAYIDSLAEGCRVLVEQAGSTLETIAWDVKLQVEFNPAEVEAWRLLGYENRLLRDTDFNDDAKDAGELGAGQSMIALYEIVPHGAQAGLVARDPLKYQTASAPSAVAGSGELLTVKIRYQAPAGEPSRLLALPFTDAGQTLATASPDFQFAAAVAAFGMVLRDSPHRAGWTFAEVRALAEQGFAGNPGDDRSEFLDLVASAATLTRRAGL